MNLMKPNLFLGWIISIVIIMGVSITRVYKIEDQLTGYVTAYQEMSYKIEREFIENIPVYRDYVKPEFVRELQKFDLTAHAAQAVKHGVAPLKNLEDINGNVKSGKLVAVGSTGDELFYFHNVQKEYRYLTPLCKSGLELVASRFQQKLQAHKTGLPTVKLAVSSMIRTVDYQEKIFGRKFVSVHSYGGCFDLYLDDYFVQLPSPPGKESAQEKIRKSLHSRTGFLLGDALREQFRTVLMETLLELQKEERIYVFLEDDRRCFHITVPVR